MNNFLANRQNLAKNIQVHPFLWKTVHCIEGHRDDSKANENANKGNFLALLEFHVDASNEILKSDLATCGMNARYSSQTIQNQIIALIRDHLQIQLLMKSKKQSTFQFSVMK